MAEIATGAACARRADDDTVVWREETRWHAARIGMVAMSSPLVHRVEVLEKKVNLLRELPGRVATVETQITALRGEMASFRTEVREEFAAVRAEMSNDFAAVRAEMRAGDEETRRYMRVLHEDVISRIALLQESMDR